MVTERDLFISHVLDQECFPKNIYTCENCAIFINKKCKGHNLTEGQILDCMLMKAMQISRSDDWQEEMRKLGFNY